MYGHGICGPGNPNCDENDPNCDLYEGRLTEEEEIQQGMDQYKDDRGWTGGD